MLTIYNRQKAKVGALQTSGHNMDVYDVAIQRRLNSELSLTFQIPMTSSKYALIEEEGLIECEGQKYVIKKRARNRQGMGRTVQITCQHVMRRMMDIRIPYTSAINEAFGASIYALTNAISAATGGVFTFQIIDTFPVKDVYKWGYSNCLKAFQDLVNLYGAEFVPDNYVIKLYNKINIDNGMQYRYAKNIIDDSFETNTDTLCTRMTGLAKDSLTIIDLPASYLTTDEYNRLNAVSGAIIGGVIKVPYLISQYAAAWATPDNIFFDNEFEDNDIDASTTAGKVLLLEEIRKKLAQSEVPDIQVKVNAADLWKTNTTRAIRPQLGETVFLVDQLMELDNITARIMEMTEYPFDPSKNTSVTLANFLLKDYNDIVSDLNASKNTLDGLLTNKKINAERFEDFARQAVHDIDNSKTEIVYDERGIVLIEKTNLLEQVVLASQGMYLTTDGGLTSRVAITANGIVADEIRVGILRGIRIEGVTIIGSLIKTSDTSYPRVELSSTDILFGAYQSAVSFLTISPDAYGSTPGIVMQNSLAIALMYLISDSLMLLTASGEADIQLGSGKNLDLFCNATSGYKTRFNSWAAMLNVDSGNTLQQDLDVLITQGNTNQVNINTLFSDVSNLYDYCDSLSSRVSAVEATDPVPGPMGPQGPKGDTGDTGPQGPAGTC